MTTKVCELTSNADTFIFMGVPLIAFFALLLSFYGEKYLPRSPEQSSQVLGATVSDNQINTGLKEVLSLSTMNAVTRTGIENGFWGNDSIKIPLPEPLLTSEKGLKLMGQGLNIDKFELSMNRVAEAVAPAATPIFNQAIVEKSFSDVRVVLNGGSTAITDDLRRSAYQMMVKALRPAVISAMDKTDIQRQFDSLAKQYTGLTLGEKCQLDLTDYLTRSILSGLFIITGQEEANIRANPQSQNQRVSIVFALP